MTTQQLTAETARKAYELAGAAARGMTGYYNENYRVETSAGPVLVRIPIAGCDEMDIRSFPESDILRVLAVHQINAPRVLFVSNAPMFQIHEYIEGVPGNIAFPAGAAIPEHFIPDVIETIDALHRVRSSELPAALADWPADGDSTGILLRLIANTQRVYDQSVGRFGWLYREIGIPADPLGDVRAESETLSRRPFRLCHCDIHRKNVILSDGVTCFLDWEHALFGDPIYELAVHLHKMSYPAAAERRFVELARERLDEETTTAYDRDLDVYRRHERMKSVIVDAVRYRKQATAPGVEAAQIEYLAGKLAEKTAQAAPLWGSRSLSGEQARELLTMAPHR
jgi:aminoglycoside phosphotransferase (APT) family kinase protein